MEQMFFVFIYLILGTIINAVVVVNEHKQGKLSDDILERWTFHQLLTVIFWPFVVLTRFFKTIVKKIMKSN